MFFGWVFFLISLGSPHVRPTGCTCGEPDEIELAAIGVELNGSGHVLARLVEQNRPRVPKRSRIINHGRRSVRFRLAVGRRTLMRHTPMRVLSTRCAPNEIKKKQPSEQHSRSLSCRRRDGNAVMTYTSKKAMLLANSSMTCFEGSTSTVT